MLLDQRKRSRYAALGHIILSSSNADHTLLEQIAGGPISAIAPGRWGFTNRTDIITLADGDRMVVQRYRRREDAESRLRAMQALQSPMAQADIAIPALRRFDLSADPPWAIFDLLPGIPLPEAGDAGLDGPRFPYFARRMGQILPRLRQIPTSGLQLNDGWADPKHLAEAAAVWAEDIPEISVRRRATLTRVIAELPALFDGRQAVLAHGDFTPVNVLVEGEAITGLLDFESVRLADSLFDAAWWAWAVEYHDPLVFQRAWRPFAHGAEIDVDDPQTLQRITALQTIRLLELVAAPNAVGPDIRRILVNQLQAKLT